MGRYTIPLNVETRIFGIVITVLEHGRIHQAQKGLSCEACNELGKKYLDWLSDVKRRVNTV